MNYVVAEENVVFSHSIQNETNCNRRQTEDHISLYISFCNRNESNLGNQWCTNPVFHIHIAHTKKLQNAIIEQ